jgi:hypothetical protein
MANITILPPRQPPPEPKEEKLNRRQELFCQGCAAGMRKMDAYVAAGYSGTYKNKTSQPSHLLREPKIRNRIRVLKAQMAFKLDVTVEKLVLELTEAFEVAKRDINPQGMVVATLGKAKLLGFLADTKIDEGRIPKPMNQPGEYAEMTIEQWEEKFRPKLLQ